MIEDFVQRFKTTVDALLSHPRVRVTHVWIGPPASDEALSGLAEVWGPVPTALAALYRQADGLQLRWVDIAHETYDPARDDKTSYARVWSALHEQGGDPAGLLDLPPIEVLAERDAVGAMFGDDDGDLARAVAFDSFSESEDAVVYFGDQDDPWVSVASDHLADVPEPGERRLSEYLEHLLATWASVWHRHTTAPQRLDDLLRRRTALDPTHVVGRRVMYVDGGRAHSVMHGRALSLVEAPSAPSWWPFARTMAEVEDDLGETLYVPMRALYLPDESDAYERLWADRAAVRTILEGPALALFERFAPVAEHGDRQCIAGGPAVADGAWPFTALCGAALGEQSVGSLVIAVQTLLAHAERNVERAVGWPPGLPRRPRRTTSFLSTLAAILLDVVAVYAARRNPPDLAAWLGVDTTRRLRDVLSLVAASNRLRGYDPRTDPQTSVGYLSSALAGRAPALSVAASGTRRGTEFGLPDLRVVEVVTNDPPG